MSSVESASLDDLDPDQRREAKRYILELKRGNKGAGRPIVKRERERERDKKKFDLRKGQGSHKRSQ